MATNDAARALEELPYAEYYFCGMTQDDDDKFSSVANNMHDLCPVVGECGHTFCVKSVKNWQKALKPKTTENLPKIVRCQYHCTIKMKGELPGITKMKYIPAFRMENLSANFSLCTAMTDIDDLKAKMLLSQTNQDQLVKKAIEEATFQKCSECEKEFTTESGASRAPIVGVCGHTVCCACLFDLHAEAVNNTKSNNRNLKNVDCPTCWRKKSFHSERYYENIGLRSALRYWNALQHHHHQQKQQQQGTDYLQEKENDNTVVVGIKREDPQSAEYTIIKTKSTCHSQGNNNNNNNCTETERVIKTEDDEEADSIVVFIPEDDDPSGEDNDDVITVDDSSDGDGDDNAEEAAAAESAARSIADDPPVHEVVVRQEEAAQVVLLDEDDKCQAPNDNQQRELKQMLAQNKLQFLCLNEFDANIRWRICRIDANISWRIYRYDVHQQNGQLVCIAPDSFVKQFLGRERYNHESKCSKSTAFQALQYNNGWNKWRVTTFAKDVKTVEADYIKATFRRELVGKAEKNPNRWQDIKPWGRVSPRINLRAASSISENKVQYPFVHESTDWKLIYAFASAVHHLGLRTEAKTMMEKMKMNPTDGDQIKRLHEAVDKYLPKHKLQHNKHHSSWIHEEAGSRASLLHVMRPKLTMRPELTCLLVVYNRLIFEPESERALCAISENFAVCCASADAGQVFGVEESWTLMEKVPTTARPRKRKLRPLKLIKQPDPSDVVVID